MNVQRDVLDQVEVVNDLNYALVQLKIFGGEKLVHIGKALLSTKRNDLVQEGLILVIILNAFSGLLNFVTLC